MYSVLSECIMHKCSSLFYFQYFFIRFRSYIILYMRLNQILFKVEVQFTFFSTLVTALPFLVLNVGDFVIFLSKLTIYFSNHKLLTFFLQSVKRNQIYVKNFLFNLSVILIFGIIKSTV